MNIDLKKHEERFVAKEVTAYTSGLCHHLLVAVLALSIKNVCTHYH